MAIAWNTLFDNVGVKRVSKTDKEKSAYLPTTPQRAALAAAGIVPSSEGAGTRFEFAVLFDDRATIRASYYLSMRGEAAKRKPEARLGSEIISGWLEEGDALLIGNIGPQPFAVKLTDDSLTDLEFADAVARRASTQARQALIDRAKQATGTPAKIRVTRNGFVRNPVVVMGAIARAEGRCEMPRCACPLFERVDGGVYLEVHHIRMLAEGGDDTLANVAALCPSCHRELHHGARHKELRQALAEHISGLEV